MKVDYKIAAVFFTSHPDTVGNSIRLSILRFLSEAFTLVLYSNCKMAEFDSYINVEIHYIANKHAGRLQLLSDLSFWRKVALKIGKERVDSVFLFHDTAPICLWVDLPCFQFVHQTHEMIGIGVERFYRRIFNKFREILILKGLRRSKKVFAVSEPIIDYLARKRVKNLIYTPHGVNLSLYKNPCVTEFHQSIKKLKTEGKFIVCYTGWVSENRGLWLMLEGIKQAVQHNNKIVFVIVGSECKYLDIIKEFSVKNNLENHIISYGRIDHSMIPGILAHSNVCLSFLDIIPTYEMSPPQKVIEYFAAGKPVIGNRIKSHETLIQHGFNGLIIDSDSTQVAKTILLLAEDRSLLEKMSYNASKSAAMFDFNSVYGRMIQEISEWLKNG